ncbi:MAG: methionine synthase, partial [Planctomycetes bacterium]|nr:methionine synthase [Planctomycetota bacterium]
GAFELEQRFASELDDYSAILAKALADRLAEALAEYQHLIARNHWYAPSEKLSYGELIDEAYQGIRPAAGYPSCPDHTEKSTIWRLLTPDQQVGISLTESFAMSPAASVSGMYFGHPQAKYFAVDMITRDQVHDYAKRKSMDAGTMEQWLQPVLGYDPT